jgi:ribosomal protein S18 acetylase RimI-like enzyme
MITDIRHTTKPEDLAWGAALMASQEPWITLRRSYAASLELLQQDLSEVYLCFVDQERAGFILIKRKGSFVGYIQTIVIDERFRGKGIGTQLIRFAEEKIGESSPNVFICVSSFNHRAHRLYLSLGYEEVGMLKDYIRKGYDEILLRKSTGAWNDFHPQKP